MHTSHLHHSILFRTLLDARVVHLMDEQVLVQQLDGGSAEGVTVQLVLDLGGHVFADVEHVAVTQDQLIVTNSVGALAWLPYSEIIEEVGMLGWVSFAVTKLTLCTANAVEPSSTVQTDRVRW
jgi:hypothetical protein